MQITTKDELIKYVIYDETTGLFTHKERSIDLFTSERNMKKWNTRYAGKTSGRKRTHKTGVNGVTIHSQNGKYVSKIQSDNKTYSLGCFVDFFEACCARKSAERKFNFHINNSSVRNL